jgi:hypothetical protein
VTTSFGSRRLTTNALGDDTVFVSLDGTVFDVSNPVVALRWATVALAALSNARYQSSKWLYIAAPVSTAFVAVGAEFELPDCVKLGGSAISLQQQQDANAAAATAAGNNITDFSLVLPISLLSAELWTVVIQRFFLWGVSVTVCCFLWRLFWVFNGQHVRAAANRTRRCDFGWILDAFRPIWSLLRCGPCRESGTSAPNEKTVLNPSLRQQREKER